MAVIRASTRPSSTNHSGIVYRVFCVRDRADVDRLSAAAGGKINPTRRRSFCDRFCDRLNKARPRKGVGCRGLYHVAQGIRGKGCTTRVYVTYVLHTRPASVAMARAKSLKAAPFPPYGEPLVLTNARGRGDRSGCTGVKIKRTHLYLAAIGAAVFL
jgi:hypothetical protein